MRQERKHEWESHGKNAVRAMDGGEGNLGAHRILYCGRRVEELGDGPLKSQESPGVPQLGPPPFENPITAMDPQ